MFHGDFWSSGFWILPIIGLACMILFMFLMFGRRGFGPRWQGPGRYDSGSRDRYASRRGESETALEILEKRYARGETSKEEFDLDTHTR
jgi:uncharacterized membrane protein